MYAVLSMLAAFSALVFPAWFAYVCFEMYSGTRKNGKAVESEAIPLRQGYLDLPTVNPWA
jgi:hypothetical protein